MGRTPSVAIAVTRAQAAASEAQTQFDSTKCALTRANNEYDKANMAFEKETIGVRGIPLEDYPQTFFDARDRRDRAFDKLGAATAAYDEAREKRDTARDAEVDAVHAAAVAEMRKASRRGAYYATA